MEQEELLLAYKSIQDLQKTGIDFRWTSPNGFICDTLNCAKIILLNQITSKLTRIIGDYIVYWDYNINDFVFSEEYYRGIENWSSKIQ